MVGRAPETIPARVGRWVTFIQPNTSTSTSFRMKMLLQKQQMELIKGSFEKSHILGFPSLLVQIKYNEKQIT